MIVGTYFNGDDDHEVAWMQHDAYHRAHGIIIESCNHFVRVSKSLLDVNSPIEWGSITSCDHRTLQAAHDLLAAAWRFRHDQRQSTLPLEPKPGATEKDTPESMWVSWLRDEINGWNWRPELVRNVQLILANQNQPIGYHAEARLCLAILDRFPDVPWKPNLRAAYETELEAENSNRVTEKPNQGTINWLGLEITWGWSSPMAVAGKAFLYFVYYKALSVMLFPKTLTVLAAALIAIAAIGIDYVVHQNQVQQRLPAAWAFVAVIAGTYFASLVIAYGFSESCWLYSFGVSGGGWWKSYKEFLSRILCDLP